MISAISVKDKLKNQARENGRTMQDEERLATQSHIGKR